MSDAMKSSGLKIGIVLVGHGSPATDCPPEFVGEMMGLEWRKNSQPGGTSESQVQQRIAQLDQKIRTWPRTDRNDPYKVGLEKLADKLKPLLNGKLFAIAYNEFCSPTLEQTVGELVRQGAERILVIPTMLTPGGLHSEKDIPRSIEEVRRLHPAVSMEYLWPFDLAAVAGLLADQIGRVCP